MSAIKTGRTYVNGKVVRQVCGALCVKEVSLNDVPISTETDEVFYIEDGVVGRASRADFAKWAKLQVEPR